MLEKTQDFQGTSKNTAYGNSRDAIHFAKIVQEEVADDKVKAAAAKAIDTLEASLVGDVANGKRMEEANGISVFAPTNYGFMSPTARRSSRTVCATPNTPKPTSPRTPSGMSCSAAPPRMAS